MSDWIENVKLDVGGSVWLLCWSHKQCLLSSSTWISNLFLSWDQRLSPVSLCTNTLLQVPAFVTWAFPFFQESQWNELLETLHRLPIPDPGVSVHLNVVSGTGWWPPQERMFVWTLRGGQSHTCSLSPGSRPSGMWDSFSLWDSLKNRCFSNDHSYS